MNPIMTNFMLSGNRINGGGRSLRNSGGGHGFLPVLLDRMNASGGKSVQGNAHPLEVLRKGLLSKGGTLDRIVIKREDIDVLKAFLYRSGYSVEDVDPFLAELMARNSRGEVNLSQFFNGIDKISPSEGKKRHPIILDASMALHFESVLRDLGVSPGETEQIIGAARVDGGGINLGRFISALETVVSDYVPGVGGGETELGRFISGLKTIVSDYVPGGDVGEAELDRFISALEAIISEHAPGVGGGETELGRFISGLKTIIPDHTPGGYLSSIPDLQRAEKESSPTPARVKRIAGMIRKDTGKQDPAKALLLLKTIAAQLGEKTRGILGSASTDPAISTDSVTKSTEGDLGKVPMPSGKQGHPSMKAFIAALEQEGTRPAEGKGMTPQTKAGIDRILETATIQDNTRESALSLQSLSKSGLVDPLLGSGTIRKGQPAKPLHFRSELAIDNADDAPSSSLSGSWKKVEAASNPFGVRHLQKETEPVAEGRIPKSAKPIEMLTEVSSRPVFSESVGGKRAAGERPIPAYLVNQVGRQISRSLLKGQNRIRLQLKPPEMGTLKIDMNMHGNTLKLGIIAENSAIKDLLLSNIPQLREALVEQGVKLDRLDVQIDSFDQSREGLNDRSYKELKRDQTGFQGTNSDSGPGELPEDDTGHILPGLSELAASDHRLDLMA